MFGIKANEACPFLKKYEKDVTKVKTEEFKQEVRVTERKSTMA